MPYYTETLLSGSTKLLYGSPYRPPPAKIPEQVLKTMRMVDFVGYAALPPELRGKRNVAPKEPVNKDEGRFRSKGKRAQEPEDVSITAPGSNTGADFGGVSERDVSHRRFGLS